MRLDPEISWAYWARYIYINRYMAAPKSVYNELLDLIKEKDYFVITTNVDHQFQKADFDKKRLFYTQGDYGLFQTLDGRNGRTYDNEEWVMRAMEAQGFVMGADGVYQIPEDGKLSMEIPHELIPKCPDDGSAVTMNLRADDSFCEDEGWYNASEQYSKFLYARVFGFGFFFSTTSINFYCKINVIKLKFSIIKNTYIIFEKTFI